MRLTRIEARDFLGYEHLDLDLTDTDTLVVVGPNGAGKSTILDAITWPLFNRARSTAPDKMIRDGADLAHVRVSFEAGGHDIVVTRDKPRDRTGTLALEVDGVTKTAHTVRETLSTIEKYVGLPVDALLAGPFMVQKQSDSFMAAEPRDRKDMLIGLLNDLAIYEDLYDAARACQFQFEGARQAAEARLVTLQATIGAGADLKHRVENARASLAAASSHADEQQAALNALLVRAEASTAERQRLAAVENQRVRCEMDLETAHKRLSGLFARRVELDVVPPAPYVDDFDERVLTEAQSRLQAARVAREAYLSWSAREERLAADVARAEQDIAILDVVPCQHLDKDVVLPAQHLRVVAEAAERCLSCQFLVNARHVREALPGLEDLATKALAEAAEAKPLADSLTAESANVDELLKYKRAHDEAAGRYAAWHADMQSRSARVDEIEESMGDVYARYESLAADWDRLQAERAPLIEARDAWDHLQSAVAERRANVETAKRRLTAAETALADLTVEERLLEKARADEQTEAAAVEYARERAAAYGYLMRAFHRDGIPTSIIESVIEDIEAHANEVLARLPGDLRISIRSQRDTKTGGKVERLDIVVLTDGWERDYGLLSVGQRFRVDLAVRIGLSRFLSHRRGVKIETLWLDEPLADLDVESREAVVETLNVVAEDFSLMVVVSHHPEFNDAFGRVLFVSMEGGVSTATLAA